jgi:hypothetical protein
LAALAAVLVLATGGPPSVQDVAQAALLPPTGPVPAGAHVGAVRFPDSQEAHGWQLAGARSDSLGGRHALTVTYRHGTWSLGYTVVDGSPLKLPAGRRTERYVVTRSGNATVVTWHEAGRTCVVASRSVPERLLLHFASWS